MAITEAKRSPRKKQLGRSRRRLRSETYKKKAYRRVAHFPQAKGKTVEDVEFSTSPGYHNISINFQDKTSLNFAIETGFTLETDYSDWKTGNQRVLRKWERIST